MSKRKLRALVDGQPRRAAGTIRGCRRSPAMRRRGYTPEAIRAFCDMVGVAKANSMVDIGKLEYCVRDDLNHNAPRVLGVLRSDRGRADGLARRRRRDRRAVLSRPTSASPARARCRSAARSTSIAMTGATIHRPAISGSRPAARCACATATASPPTKSSRAMRRAPRRSCARPCTSTRAAARIPRMAARSGA